MLSLFQFDFMQRAFEAGVMIAVIAPLIGIFLVARRYSMISDTLAHVSLAGVALGVILGIHPILMAMAASLVAVLGMELMRSRQKLLSESVLVVFLSGSLALAVVLLGFAKGANANFMSYLFGSITTVSPDDLKIMAVVAPLIFVSVIAFFKEFYLISFDEEVARASGLRVTLLNLLQMLLAALLISISIRVVGVLLVGALMVIPVLTAQRLAHSFKATAVIAVFLALFSVVIGLWVSYLYNLASGGSIVLTGLALFAIVSLVMPRRS